MKNFINLFALAVLVVTSAHASLITITLDNPNQSGVAGETLSFYGVITNEDANANDAPIYLNGPAFQFTLTDAAHNEIDNFLANVPISLASGASSDPIDLFDITLALPGSLPYGTYTGFYELQGGRDGGDFNGTDNLGQADFSVTFAPEPGTIALFGIGLVFLGWLKHRQPVSVR